MYKATSERGQPVGRSVKVGQVVTQLKITIAFYHCHLETPKVNTLTRIFWELIPLTTRGHGKQFLEELVSSLVACKIVKELNHPRSSANVTNSLSSVKVGVGA